VRRSLGAVAPDLLLRLHERHPERYPVLLESVGGAAQLGRYDVLFALPGRQLQLRPDGSLDGPCGPAGGSSFLGCLDAWWSSERGAGQAPDALPFSGGWFVYLGYELAGEIEPRLRLRESRLPRALAWRMHGAVVRDRLTGEAMACAEPQAPGTLQQDLDADLAEAADGARPAAVPLALVVEEDEPERFLRAGRDADAAAEAGVLDEAGDAAVGTRMGVFGAAQGVASGLGGLMGAVASDVGRAAFGSVEVGYGAVFVLEALMFAGAAVLASRSAAGAPGAMRRALERNGDAMLEAVT
jgi:anthranilate synthase component 1